MTVSDSPFVYPGYGLNRTRHYCRRTHFLSLKNIHRPSVKKPGNGEVMDLKDQSDIVTSVSGSYVFTDYGCFFDIEYLFVCW